MADWLNAAYDEETLKQAARSFALSGKLQLISFLSEKGLQQFNGMKFIRAYVPVMYSYHLANAPRFAFSEEFRKIMCRLVGSEVKVSDLAVIRHQHGDYSLLYDMLKPGRHTIFMLDIAEMKEEWGAWTSFLKGNEEVFRVVPKRNALTLVNQKGLRCFTKYVNHNAKNPRTFLYGVLHK